MTANDPNALGDVDVASLYREDVFTDLRVAALRRLTPAKADGTVDTSRPVMLIAGTQFMSQVGAVPISTQVEAKDLPEAIAAGADGRS